MTVTTFPAQPGTFLIERDTSVNPPNVIRIPVIGWTHVQGNMAFPVCVLNHGGLTHGRAILHPEGYVTDSVNGLTFETEAEWLAFLRTAKPKNAEEDPEPETTSDEIDDGTSSEPEPEDPDGDPIRFGTKVYKTTSFWHMPIWNAIFQIEGGSVYPSDERCEKITRDEWAKLKREGVSVLDDPHTGEIAPEDDDNDAMDLV